MLAIVYGDFFWYAEAAYNILLEKLLQGSGSNISECLSFDPLREIFHCNCSILVISWRRGQGPNDVDAPSCEGPHRRQQLYFVWWKLTVWCMPLAIWAFTDNLVCVCHRRRPVEAFAKSFAYQCPRCNMRRAHACVNLFEQLSAFFARDALQEGRAYTPSI